MIIRNRINNETILNWRECLHGLFLLLLNVVVGLILDFEASLQKFRNETPVSFKLIEEQSN